MDLSQAQWKVLRSLSKHERPAAVTEVNHPSIALTLARHGYIKLQAELTDKGRTALDGPY